MADVADLSTVNRFSVGILCRQIPTSPPICYRGF